MEHVVLAWLVSVVLIGQQPITRDTTFPTSETPSRPTPIPAGGARQDGTREVLNHSKLVTDHEPLTPGDRPPTPNHQPLSTNHQPLPTDIPTSCGVGAAFLLLDRLGCPVSLEEIEAASPVRPEAAMSLADLQKLFENLGFRAEGFRMALQRLDRPVIAFRPHPKGKVGHFVVVEPVRNANAQPSTLNPQPSSGTPPSALGPPLFLVIDPLDMPTIVPADRLQKSWDGRVLVVHPKGVVVARGGSILERHGRWILFSVAGCVACLWACLLLRRPRTARLSQSAVASTQEVVNG